MTAAVIVAAGRGIRLGGAQPKALRLMRGRPLFAYSLEAALACPLVRCAVLVVPPDYLDQVTAAPSAGAPDPRVCITPGSDSRQRSVLCGLAALPPGTEWVAVHDAARPLVTAELFAGVIAMARDTGGALAAHPATDTLKRRSSDGDVSTLPRGELWHAETPQVFPKRDLQRALDECEANGVEVTDEAEAMERWGAAPAIYHNRASNPKISTEADWSWVESLLSSR